MPDFKKEWMGKANIDYFSQFMTLWMGFNSWYKSHYSDIDGSDRRYIDKLKTDFTGRNQLYTKYQSLISEGQVKKNLWFKSNLESMHYSLNEADIHYPKGCVDRTISFTAALLNFNNRRNAVEYRNLILDIHRPNKVRLGKICITNDHSIVFPCLIEMLYQIRCLLFHGNLEPNEKTHEVVKSCYFILWDLMN